ncbi:endonuclease VII domain-containing protein [Blastococcus sp. SYSU D00922]
MESKPCPSCGETKPATDFGRNRSLGDGLSFYCLACNRAKSNAHYRKRRQALGKTVRDHSWIPEGFRWCPACQQAVAHEDYTRNAGTASGFGSRCRRCDRATNSAGYFYRKYNLTQRELRALREAQRNRCGICGAPEPEHLDHDHSSGEIRALLCQRCNQGLGLFRDEPGLLRAAADYVEFHTLSQFVVAAAEAAGLGTVRPVRPGEPPVGSQRRPGASGTSTRSTGRSSGSRRRTQAGEADG